MFPGGVYRFEIHAHFFVSGRQVRHDAKRSDTKIIGAQSRLILRMEEADGETVVFGERAVKF